MSFTCASAHLRPPPHQPRILEVLIILKVKRHLLTGAGVNNNTAGKCCNYRSQDVGSAGEEEAAGEAEQVGCEPRWPLCS